MVCDLTQAAHVAASFARIQPALVIHAAALSNVDQCEQEPALARIANVETTTHVVRALNGSGARLLFISTDYVFDGRKVGPYDEDDLPNPLGVYARSKREAEQVVLDYAHGIVVRPSTLFGPGRMNFCDHVADRLAAGQLVEAFADQVTSPTYTADLAEALFALGRWLSAPGAEGRARVYHLVNAGGCSRVEFAHCVADLTGCPRSLVRAIPMAAQQRLAVRPCNSALTSRYAPPMLERILRPWSEALEAYLRQRHPLLRLT